MLLAIAQFMAGLKISYFPSPAILVKITATYKKLYKSYSPFQRTSAIRQRIYSLAGYGIGADDK